MFLRVLVPLFFVVLATAAKESFGLDPEPPVGNVGVPRLNSSSSLNPRNLLELFERQSESECYSAAGARFGCAPNICCNGEPAMGCCYPGQDCITLNGNHECCPTDYTTCGNTMCTYGNSTCCADQPGTACGPEQSCCGNGCCNSGYSCCTGSGGAKCCDDYGSQCCGGVCCPTTQDCCGDVCCDAGWTCETRGKCTRKTTAVRTSTTTATSIVTAGSTNAAAAMGRLGEKIGALGGLLAAGLL